MDMDYDLEEVLESLDDNFNFNQSLNKLIEQEVEVRLNEKINHYSVAMQERKELLEKKNSLQAEVNHLQSELDNAKTQFFKEGSDEAEREMLGGFKLDDKVWFINLDITRMECTECNKGYIFLDFKGQEVKAECPKCSHGRIRHEKRCVTDGRIEEIEIHTWNHGKQLDTTIYVEPLSIRKADSSLRFNISQLFGSREGAEQKLNELEGESK